VGARIMCPAAASRAGRDLRRQHAHPDGFRVGESLSFFVPALDPNKNYQVVINGSAGNSRSAPFASMRARPGGPGSLTLRTGDRQTLTFTVPNAAPVGGLLLDITPMCRRAWSCPEVVIPAGRIQSRSRSRAAGRNGIFSSRVMLRGSLRPGDNHGQVSRNLLSGAGAFRSGLFCAKFW